MHEYLKEMSANNIKKLTLQVLISCVEIKTFYSFCHAIWTVHKKSALKVITNTVGLLKKLVMLREKARKLIDEAKRKGLWLYEQSCNRWYTPEEFQHIFHYTNSKDYFFDTIQLRDPNEAIEAGFKKLNEVQEKLEWFVKKVNAYYGKGNR